MRTAGSNWQLIRDNAYVGIHDMTVTGKALAQAFYGTAPAEVVLQRVLDGRPAGVERGATISGGL